MCVRVCVCPEFAPRLHADFASPIAVTPQTHNPRRCARVLSGEREPSCNDRFHFPKCSGNVQDLQTWTLGPGGGRAFKSLQGDSTSPRIEPRASILGQNSEITSGRPNSGLDRTRFNRFVPGFRCFPPKLAGRIPLKAKVCSDSAKLGYDSTEFGRDRPFFPRNRPNMARMPPNLAGFDRLWPRMGQLWGWCGQMWA